MSAHITRRPRLLVVAVLVGALAGSCSSGSGQTEEVRRAATSTSTAGASVTSTTAPGPEPTTTIVAGIIVATVGQTVTTREGNRVTLHSFEYPVAADHPDPSRLYAAADLEACAGAAAEQDVGVAPGMFRVELADKTPWPPVQPAKQPALQPTELAPGRCARGWVTFSLPKNVSPLLVTMRTSTDVAWRLR
jgi:hypothetical protein